MVKAVGLDHVVLNVADVERSLAWYCGELGLEGLRVEEWRRGEVFFPSLRLDATTIIDLLQSERTGQNVDHVCLATGAVSTCSTRTETWSSFASIRDTGGRSGSRPLVRFRTVLKQRAMSCTQEAGAEEEVSKEYHLGCRHREVVQLGEGLRLHLS